MWNKQQTGAPGSSPSPAPNFPASNYGANPSSYPDSSGSRIPACLGASLQIKGELTGTEDLQIEGKVEGPISLDGHALIVGPAAQLNSKIEARDVIVFGKVVGDVRARDRVDIRGDGSVIGDITTVRISIEDGAYFKGRIEILQSKQAIQPASASAAPGAASSGAFSGATKSASTASASAAAASASSSGPTAAPKSPAAPGASAPASSSVSSPAAVPSKAS